MANIHSVFYQADLPKELRRGRGRLRHDQNFQEEELATMEVAFDWLIENVIQFGRFTVNLSDDTGMRCQQLPGVSFKTGDVLELPIFFDVPQGQLVGLACSVYYDILQLDQIQDLPYFEFYRTRVIISMRTTSGGVAGCTLSLLVLTT